VATLEKAGDAATLTGTISFGGITKTTNEVNTPFSLPTFNVNESIAIAPFTVTKTASDDCFEEGEEGYYELSVSGADLKKTTSVFILIDKMPENVELLHASLYFKGDNGISDREVAIIAKGEEGLATYQFLNTQYFFNNKQAASQTINNGVEYSYDWYDVYTMRMDFTISGESVEPGERINTGLFVYETPLFTYSYWEASKLASNSALFTDFEDVDFEFLDEVYTSIQAFKVIHLSLS
jgi:hypothetical protein